MADVFVSATGTAPYPGTKTIPTSLTTALSSVVAGDVVYLAPGVYRVQLTMTRSGTTSQRIRIVGDPTNTQQITGATGNVVRVTTFQSDVANPTDTLTPALRLSSCSYLDLSGIYFEGRQGSNNYCYRVSGGTEITHDRCVFNNANGSFGIQVDTSATNILFDRCLIPFGVARIESCTNITFTRSYLGITGIGVATNINAYNCILNGYGNQVNGATPISYIYNNICFGNIAGNNSNATVEDYNVCSGRLNIPTLGANTRTTGTMSQDWYYSVMNGVGNVPAFAALSGTPMIGGGTTAQGVSSDMFGRTWVTGRNIGAIETLSIDGVSPYLPYDSTFQTLQVAAGTTGYTVYLQLGASGMTHTTTGLSVTYVKSGGTSTPISLVEQTPTGAWVSGGFCAVNNTTNPGLYRLDVPNAVFTSGYEQSFILARGVGQSLGTTVVLQEPPVLGSQVRMGPFTVQADGVLTDERLKLYKGSIHSIDFKMVDQYGTGVDGTGTVVTANVYNSAGFLVDSYPCTAKYAEDGRYSFAIDATVTNVVGMYTINISRQIGSEINVFGRMKLEVLSP